MKILAFCISLIFVTVVNALTLEIVDGERTLLFSKVEDVLLSKNVGQITIALLKQNQISYQGSESGLSMIDALGQDLQVISDTEMKAFGWCFSIDGQVAELMPDQVFITRQDSLLKWYYGFAHYKDGQWISQCLQ